MDPRRVSRLVEWTAVGEDGEGFYIARSGSKFDLLVISEGGPFRHLADRLGNTSARIEQPIQMQNS
jgi:hypothetical protein